MNVSKWTVLAIVGVGVFMCTLDSSIVNVSLPAIAAYFGSRPGAAVEWVLIAYLVIIASSLLTIGRLADRIGRKPIWIAGLVVFTTGSTLCGAAPSLPLLIAARVLQGVGGACLMAVSPALLTAAFPPRERGRALGLNATIVALGISAGPALGGWITQAASWRWIFYVNVPIGVTGVIATALLLPHERRAHHGGRFDLGGAIALGVALAALTAGLSVGNDVGWSSRYVLILAALAVVTGVWFVRHELGAEAALLDHRLFADRLFTWATISLVVSFVAAFAIAFLLPFYLLGLRGFGLARTGLLLTPFPLVVMVVAPVSGHLADRIGTRVLASVGIAVLAVGLVLMARLDARSSIAYLVFAQAVAALGQGLFQSPNNSAIMGAAPRDRQGVAAGMLATGRTMGQSLGVAIAGAVFLAGGFRPAFLVAAAIAAAGVITSLARGREQVASGVAGAASGVAGAPDATAS